MSDKIARLGIERDNDLMYYIKNGDVWATPRKQKGQPKGKPHKVAATGLEMDYSRYLYFLDGDGDVARKERALGGGRAKKSRLEAKPAKPSRPAKTKGVTKGAPAKAVPAKAVPAKAAAASGKKKSRAQLEREIEECLSRSPKS